MLKLALLGVAVIVAVMISAATLSAIWDEMDGE